MNLLGETEFINLTHLDNGVFMSDRRFPEYLI